MKRPNKDFRCYVCGEPVGASFKLVALTKEVDRVFVIHAGECVKRVEDAATICGVTRARI